MRGFRTMVRLESTHAWRRRRRSRWKEALSRRAKPHSQHLALDWRKLQLHNMEMLHLPSKVNGFLPLMPATSKQSGGWRIVLPRRAFLRGTRAFCSSGLGGNGNGQKSRDKDTFEEAIFQLEGSLKEPAEVLDGMRDRLSAQDLQGVLSYFAEEGRDSWFALEVFEWMLKVNKASVDTQRLMLSIMHNWAMKLVEQGGPVEQVSSLLEDMDCVGLAPDAHIWQSIISAYWERGQKSAALDFVRRVMRVVAPDDVDPLGFLLTKMISSKETSKALKLLVDFRQAGFPLKHSTFGTAILAAVSEQEQVTRHLHQLLVYQRRGLVRISAEEINASLISYQESLHEVAEDIARWADAAAAETGGDKSKVTVLIHERLLAMYCLAGKGLDAERHLWQLKLAGRKPGPEMFNTIMGICAFNKQPKEAYEILRKMEASGTEATNKTLSVLIGGFVKGGNPVEAASCIEQMLLRGLRPEFHEILAVLKALHSAGLISLYLAFSKALARQGLLQPCVLYFYMDSIKLCVIRMLL